MFDEQRGRYRNRFRRPESIVRLAQAAIPVVMSDIPQTQEIKGSELCRRMRSSGHTLSASEWAIHESILRGWLKVGLIYQSGLGAVLDGQAHDFGRGYANIEEGKPTPYDRFLVIATEQLWEWWRENTNSNDLETHKLLESGSIQIMSDTDTKSNDQFDNYRDRDALENAAIAQLLTGNVNVKRIAEKIGVPRATLYGWPKFRTAYDNVKKMPRRGIRDRGDDFSDEDAE